ncbi:MAG: hypothetical protein RLZ55_1034 [Actinomycetota bacterium]|jgi:hypothetical protein
MISDWLYPPVFYNYVSLFAGPDPAQGIFGMRLGVIVSVVALFTLSYLVSLSWLRPAMIVSWAVCAMPFGAAMLSSINPTAWALAGLVGAPWGFRDYNSLLGWFDVPMPPGVWLPNLLIVGMFGAAGLAWMPWRKALSLGILVVFAFVVPLRSLIQLHVLAGEVFSPRYWAPLAVAALGLLLIAKPDRRIELTAWQWWLTWVAMVYVAAVALHVRASAAHAQPGQRSERREATTAA